MREGAAEAAGELTSENVILAKYKIFHHPSE